MSSRVLRGASIAAGLFSLAPLAAAFQEAPFRVLDNHEGAWLDLVATPIRPMALEPGSQDLWAVNSHDSTVVEFAPDGTLLRTIRVPWGPVSIAHWDMVGEDASVLVVCRNTNTLARIDVASGEIVSLFDLGSEPADVLVHPDSLHAFVSVSGIDLVVEIDVAKNRLVNRYAIDANRPTFMTLVGTDVLVAPMITGNNSSVDTGTGLLDPGPGRVLDLEDPTVALQGLKDHDLFLITPGSQPVPVARDVAAVSFALGVNPATGEVWQLGTEANNKDKDKFGEPAVRGDFIVNQAARLSLSSGNIVEPLEVINLDDQDPFTAEVQYDPAKSVGQPYAIDFGPGGEVFVTGLLTDNVLELTSAGAFVREWDVGSIPRAVMVSPAGTGAFVYAWGDNTIELYDLAQTPPLQTGILDLGFDPTPAERQIGRAVFFDASHSMFNNASCASCHIETDSDLLPWDLSDGEFDDKGPLVTQFMRGIEQLVPFHWRGERDDLINFNGAFDGLLGGPPLDTTPGGEFDLFQDYVFSTVQPANPNTDERRVVANRNVIRSVDGQKHNANAVTGQDLFFDFGSLPIVGACATCHAMPTGTNNEIIFDEPFIDHARRTHFVTASFNGVWRKKQHGLEQIQLADGHFETRPALGVGVSAAGLKDDLLDFVNIPAFIMSQQQRRNITAFVEQADSGLAPAVHEAVMMGGDNPRGSRNRLKKFLMRQAGARNCDVAAFGTVDLGGGPQELRWFWDRTTGLFRAEDSSVADQHVEFFISQALQGTGQNIFLGLPVGMGERFAVDFDADGLFNADELALGTDPENPDSDGDGFPDGHERDNGGDPLDPNVGSSDSTAPTVSNLRVLWVTSRVAKILFDTNEATAFDAVWTSGNQTGGDSTSVFQKTHSVLLRDLRQDAKNHDVTIDVRDHGGNVTQATIPGGVTTLPFIPTLGSVVFANASATEVQDSSGTLHYTIDGKAKNKEGGTTNGRRLRVDVFVNGVLTQDDLTGTASGPAGNTRVDVIENGLNPGDVVTIVVMTLWSQSQNFGGDWSMPGTAPEFRRWDIEYTGTGL